MAESSSSAAAPVKIAPISSASVHRISSGQGILDLAGAVKELVENALDAGANNVQVRLTEYGADLIEVADNGPGVSPENFQALTLKYYTSKISEFADLTRLSSFGFRGEALSSLCAVAKVTVITRTRDEKAAVSLQYDHSGLIVSQTCVARCVGTTVSVAALFSPLPVRRKELRKNIRREYSRLITVLQAYALIAKRVRLLCSNNSGRAGRRVFLQTNASLSMRDNISSVFGSKTVGLLDWLDLQLTDECRVEGFVSKPAAGTGRALRDRQFFFINGRPVDTPKAAKVLNEVYRSFNSLQYPMVVVNFILPTTAYDVNVTPDKRTVFVHAEVELMAACKHALQEAYRPSEDAVTRQKVRGQPQSAELPESSSTPPVRLDGNLRTTLQPDVPAGGGGEVGAGEENFQNFGSNQAQHGSQKSKISCTNWMDVGSFRSSSANKSAANTISNDGGATSSVSSVAVRKSASDTMPQNECSVSRKWTSLDGPGWPPLKKCKVGHRAEADSTSPVTSCDEELCRLQTRGKRQPSSLKQGILDDQLFKMPCGIRRVEDVMPSRIESGAGYSGVLRVSPPVQVAKSPDFGSDSANRREPSARQDLFKKKIAPQWSKQVSDKDTEHESRMGHESNVELEFEAESEQGLKSSVTGQDRLKTSPSVLWFNRLAAAEAHEAASPLKKITTVPFSMEKLRLKRDMATLLSNHSLKAPRMERSFRSATLDVNYTAGRTETEKEVALKAATNELDGCLSKAEFKRMKVLGQFNLGFILAKLDQHIFIIDQHASDEQYNFDRLMRNTSLKGQPLHRSLPLELCAADEIIITTQMETFRMLIDCSQRGLLSLVSGKEVVPSPLKDLMVTPHKKNGFDFLEDKEAPPGQRLLLSAVPSIKNMMCGVEDVQELISLLAEQPVVSSRQDLKHQGGSCALSSWPPRPTRVKAMFATQACQSSIKFGDALSKKEMEAVVLHLADVEGPWNCPHGAPTIRHMVDLGSTVKL